MCLLNREPTTHTHTHALTHLCTHARTLKLLTHPLSRTIDHLYFSLFRCCWWLLLPSSMHTVTGHVLFFLCSKFWMETSLDSTLFLRHAFSCCLSKLPESSRRPAKMMLCGSWENIYTFTLFNIHPRFYLTQGLVFYLKFRMRRLWYRLWSGTAFSFLCIFCYQKQIMIK